MSVTHPDQSPVKPLARTLPELDREGVGSEVGSPNCHPMPGSVADTLRQKLSPKMLTVCETLDKIIATRRPPLDEATEHWREGYRDGLIAARTMIERSA